MSSPPQIFLWHMWHLLAIRLHANMWHLFFNLSHIATCQIFEDVTSLQICTNIVLWRFSQFVTYLSICDIFTKMWHIEPNVWHLLHLYSGRWRNSRVPNLRHLTHLLHMCDLYMTFVTSLSARKRCHICDIICDICRDILVNMSHNYRFGTSHICHIFL